MALPAQAAGLAQRRPSASCASSDSPSVACSSLETRIYISAFVSTGDRGFMVRFNDHVDRLHTEDFATLAPVSSLATNVGSRSTARARSACVIAHW
jgi:hypothetical protein